MDEEDITEILKDIMIDIIMSPGEFKFTINFHNMQITGHKKITESDCVSDESESDE